MTTDITNEELQAEIDKLRERIETLELDVVLLKTMRINDSVPQVLPYQPQPWVFPQPYWQNPIVTYCTDTTNRM